MTEDKRQVTSSYVFCPPNPATSSQNGIEPFVPEIPAAGLAKQQQNYEKFSDFTNKRVRNYRIMQTTHGLDYTS